MGLGQTMSLDILKRELKANQIRKLYLFYGPEKYLARHYSHEIESRVVDDFARMVSYDVFEGSQKLEPIYEACQSPPLFGGRRMVVVKNAGIFKASAKPSEEGADSASRNAAGGGDEGAAPETGAQADTRAEAGTPAAGALAAGAGHGAAGEKNAGAKPASRAKKSASAGMRGMPAGTKRAAAKPGAGKLDFGTIMAELPDTSCLLVVEDEIDKRLKLFTQASKIGLVVEFPYQKPSDIERWIANIAAREGKSFERGALRHFLEKSEESMTEIRSELDKLLAYTGQRKRVTMDDIAAVCSFSLKARIFDLMDAVVAADKPKAIYELHALLTLREPAIRVMSMLSGHMILLRQVKLMTERGRRLEEITELMKLNPYRAKILQRQCRHCGLGRLEGAIQKCYEYDLAVKSGRLDKDLALELLVASILT
ncbi:MAG: DNA polymerase III subunit delta [Clostridiales bacterium]|jgi:DNA polymerase-3 subunit delta|nr:DNA polymerase III subunit delta [Clostridiales bacterium]